METISFDKVSKKYGEKTVTDSLSFSVKKAEIFGILGPNGAGKTTIIKQIMGLLVPDQGNIEVEGVDPKKDWRQIRAQIGLVPQETALYPELSARLNLEYQAALFLKSMKNAKKRIEYILELVDLSARADDLVKEFSGGMKRRLAIGRALLHEPSIIILDEPTLGVDVQGSHKIWNYIKDLSQLGKTIVVTTNVMAEAEFLCTNTLIIDNGREIVVGSPKDLVNSLGKQEIRIEFEDSLTDEQAKRYLSDYRVINNKLIVKTDNGLKDLLLLSKGLPESIKIKTVELKKPNLDDVFLHYTGKSLRD